jgi:glyoxylate/hydroxypyruvate reductase A
MYGLAEPGAPAADYAVVWVPPQATSLTSSRSSGAFSTSARALMRLLKLRLPPDRAWWCAWKTPAWRCKWPNTSAKRVIRHFRDLDCLCG